MHLKCVHSLCLMTPSKKILGSSKEVLCILVGQRAAKLQALKDSPDGISNSGLWLGVFFVFFQDKGWLKNSYLVLQPYFTPSPFLKQDFLWLKRWQTFLRPKAKKFQLQMAKTNKFGWKTLDNLTPFPFYRNFQPSFFSPPPLKMFQKV